MASFDFIVDSDSGKLLSSFTSTRGVNAPSAIYGDEPSVSVRIVEGNGNNSSLPWKDVDLTGQTIRLGIGKPAGTPTSGAFTLSYEGDTTSDLAYNASASDVETALDALASVTSAGGVTVTSFGGSGYKVEFNSAGSRTAITADVTGLSPTTTETIEETVAGDGSTQEIQVITFEQTRAAYVELTSDLTAPLATITQIRTGVLNTTSEIQRVEISGEPYAGFYSLTIDSEETGSIIPNATADELKTAIESLPSIGSGNITITGGGLDYTVEFASSLGDVGAITANLSNLAQPTGKKGSIQLNESNFLELLDGQATEQAILEIVRFTTSGSISETVCQVPITCKQDVI